jgi:hypothetical protein
MFGFAGFAEEFADVPHVTFVLEASAVEMKPQLATVTAYPLIQFTMGGLPGQSAASTYCLLKFLGRLA